jgi:hypothetical protein
VFADVEYRLKKENKLLFSRDSECLGHLLRLLERQDHRTLILWALDCARIPLMKLEVKYPFEHRPRMALDQCRAWAEGRIKMPEAKRAILDVHTAAKILGDPPYEALCHAVGQAGATVHVATHAPGLVFYELTAIVLENRQNYENEVSGRIGEYVERLMFWRDNSDDIDMKWAVFLRKDPKASDDI